MKKSIKLVMFLTFLFVITACENKVPEQVKRVVDKYDVDISKHRAVFVNDIANIRAKGTSCGGAVDSLRYNPYLEAAAKAHAKDMAVNHMVQHDGSGTLTDPAREANGIGSTFMKRIIFFGYPAKTHDLVGETVAHTKNNYLKTKDLKTHYKRALEIILNDPKHCRILMNPRFKDVGIGAYRSNDGYYWAITYGETDD